MKQARLMAPPEVKVCPECFVNMRPEIRDGFPVWRCPKCLDECQRKDGTK